jgi:hypothetical protein
VTLTQARRVLAGHDWSLGKDTSDGLEDRGMVYGKTWVFVSLLCPLGSCGYGE